LAVKVGGGGGEKLNSAEENPALVEW